MMKREVLLLFGSSLASIAAVLGLIRWLAPGLLGAPADLQLVQLDEKLPAYYEGIFREQHDRDDAFLLKDPLTRIRARPLFPRDQALGPHDILGFRNSGVPVAADIITIGDSMTYGNNAFLEQNWPSRLASHLQREDINVYNMSTGGWAAVQYLDMFTHALALRPRLVIVAFYSGNDPLESFQMAYGNTHWQALIPDPALEAGDAPAVSLNSGAEEGWDAAFRDGVHTTFTPGYRLASNDAHPAVAAGYAIMTSAAARIAELGRANGVDVVFTVIPTKELAFAAKVAAEGIAAPVDYRRLVEAERQRIDDLRARLEALAGARYVDVAQPLQQAVLDGAGIYPGTANGHPLAAGYEVIGRTLADAVSGALPPPSSGLYALMDGDTFRALLINGEGVWFVNDFDLVEANGWPPQELRTIELRDIVNLPHRGILSEVDPQRFGPACCPVVRTGQSPAGAALATREAAIPGGGSGQR